MAMTPDYFISSCGLPKLNREKYKISNSGRRKEEPLVKSDHKINATNREETKIHKNKFTLQINNDKKLLSKRTVTSIPAPMVPAIRRSSIQNNTKRCKWVMPDKEHKCLINQRIKDGMRNESHSRNHQLDNRLKHDGSNSREFYDVNQTDNKQNVHPPLET